MISRQNNVFKFVINENEFILKFFENVKSKDNMEIVLQNKEMSFGGIKEFRLFVNSLTDICEELQEIIE